MKGIFCDVCKRWFPGKPGDRHKCLAGLSTAPWDQPRQGSTVTLYLENAVLASEPELLELLKKRSPHLVDPRIEYVNWRKQGFGGEPGSVCMGISWSNER